MTITNALEVLALIGGLLGTATFGWFASRGAAIRALQVRIAVLEKAITDNKRDSDLKLASMDAQQRAVVTAKLALEADKAVLQTDKQHLLFMLSEKTALHEKAEAQLLQMRAELRALDAELTVCHNRPDCPFNHHPSIPAPVRIILSGKEPPDGP